MSETPSRRSVVVESGQRVSYFEVGEGPDIVLIHGAFVTSHDMLVSLVGPLAERFHVIAVDRPGHGRSTRPRLAGSARRQADIIVEAIRALGLRRPLVIGHSFGATVAVELALRWPDDISSVIAVAPLAFPELRLEQFLFGLRAAPVFGDLAMTAGGVGLDSALLPLIWQAMFLPQRMPDAFRTGMAFDEVRSGPGLLANGEDALALVTLAANIPEFGGCRTPISIVYGDRDIVVNPAVHARVLCRFLGAATVRRVPGAGHMLHHFQADLLLDMAVEATAALDAGGGGLSKVG